MTFETKVCFFQRKHPKYRKVSHPRIPTHLCPWRTCPGWTGPWVRPSGAWRGSLGSCDLRSSLRLLQRQRPECRNLLLSNFFEKDIICIKYFYKSMFYLGIRPVTKDYEGVERGIAGQPDLLQRTVPVAERFNPYLSPWTFRFPFSILPWPCLIVSQ